MVKQNSWLKEIHIHFESDRGKYAAKDKSKQIKKERKNKYRIIKNALDD